MATVGLFAIGTALGSTKPFIGALTTATLYGAIGSSVGGFIDNAFLFPMVFGSDDDRDVQGPRLDELKLQTAAEGSPMKKIWSNRNRIAGTLIWLSDLIEEVVTEEQSVGGKGGMGGSSVSSTRYNYYVHIAIAMCEGPLNDDNQSDNGFRRIYGDEKNVWKWDEDFHYGDNIWLYPGSATQAVNPLIEAEEGAGLVSANRHTAYFVIERFPLTDFGNRIPNFTGKLFEHDTTISDYSTQADVIESIMTRAGFDPSVINTDGITNTREVRGYGVSGPQQSVKQLEPVMLTYDVLARESGENFYFFSRGEEDEHTVDEDDIGAREFGDAESGRPITITDLSGMDLPSKVNVKFIDAGRRLQQGAVQARRIDFVTDGSASVDLPLTLLASWARQIANRLLWQSWQERQRATITLPPSYVHLEETDIVHYPYDSEVYSVRAERLSRGANYIFEVNGAIQDAETFENDVELPEEDLADPSPYTPPDTTLAIMMLPPLRDEDVTVPVYYFGMCASDASAEFLGATVYTSGDDANWSILSAIAAETTMGEAQSILGSVTNTASWDFENTLDVEMFHGELVSRTEEEVLNGYNSMLVGEEIIGFVEATLTGTNPTTGAKQYTLSKLIRGRRATESAVSEHLGFEQVVLLEGGFVRFTSHTIDLIGATRYWRGVPRDGAIADYASTQDSIEGRTVRPFAPVHGRRSYDASNNLDLSWVRRTRYLHRLFSTTATPLEESVEKYTVKIFTIGGTLLHEAIVQDATEYTYTAAQQTLDGITPGDPVNVTVQQYSTLVGNGEILYLNHRRCFSSGFSAGFG